MKGEKMKRVKFNKLTLKDFKGIENFELVFKDGLTEVEGENATGKSTILDALYWLFFGKNAKGETKFDLLPLDEEKNIIPGKEPEVTLLFDIDGEEVEFRKLQAKATKYFICGVPKKAGEFKEYVSHIVSEDLFMTLVNPVFFGDNVPWAKQKSIILDNFKIEDTVVLEEKYSSVKDELEKIGIDDMKSKYKSKVDAAKESVTKLQGTKEHLSKDLPADSGVDKDGLAKKLEDTEQLLKDTEKQLDDVYPLKDKVYKSNKQIDKIKAESLTTLKEAQAKVTAAKIKKASKTAEYKKTMVELKNVSEVCTLCGSDLDESGVKVQKENIQKKIDIIIKDGKKINTDISDLETKVVVAEGLEVDQSLLDEVSELEKKIKEIEATVDHDKIQELRVEVRDINDELI